MKRIGSPTSSTARRVDQPSAPRACATMPTRVLMLVAAALSQEFLPNYFEAEAGMSYLRFPINLWMHSQRVTGCTPGPSNHSTLRARPAPQTRHTWLRSTPESILHFLKPFFDFVDRAVDSGRSVLVHCVAGAHRAGTAGCLLLMHYHRDHQLAAKVRVHAAMPTDSPTPHPSPRLDMWACARAGRHYVHAKFATGDRAEGCAAAAARALRASRWCGVGCDYAVITALDAESSSV